MQNYEYKDLFLQDSVPKELILDFGDGDSISNDEIHYETMEIKESLCSESELRFGTCEASVFKITIANLFISRVGKHINVSKVLDGHAAEPFVYGTYKVYSDVPTADKRKRNITAYDSMYDIINSDVADWYNTILPEKTSTTTMKAFRDSFLAHFGIEQEEITLINDDVVITKTIEPSELSGKVVVTAICEINACFGHIGRDGKFQYIYLKEMTDALYPANDLYPRDDLFPRDMIGMANVSRQHYLSCTYEDFETQKISKLQIRQEENDIGCIYGTGDNCYIIEDNFLMYGKGSAELNTIAERVFNKIKHITYRPATVESKGNPCLMVGDGIRLNTRYGIVRTYILQRRLKCIQNLKDTYEAEGVEKYSEKLNSVDKSIKQLKGKTNILVRTLEETRLEMSDIERGFTASIGLTTESLKAEIKRSIDMDTELAAAAKINADNISAEVTRATAAEGTLSGRIGINAGNIELKVSKNNVISEINLSTESAVIKAPKIDLVGLVNATELTSKYATINKLNAETAELENLISKKASIKELEALEIVVEDLKTASVSTNRLNVTEIANTNAFTSKYATITKVNAVEVDVDDLDTKVANIESKLTLQGQNVSWIPKTIVTGVNFVAQTYRSNQVWFLGVDNGTEVVAL